MVSLLPLNMSLLPGAHCFSSSNIIINLDYKKEENRDIGRNCFNLEGVKESIKPVLSI
jgi:hypothetical protein